MSATWGRKDTGLENGTQAAQFPRLAVPKEWWGRGRQTALGPTANGSEIYMLKVCRRARAVSTWQAAELRRVENWCVVGSFYYEGKRESCGGVGYER